jgi:hypothetical protein
MSYKVCVRCKTPVIYTSVSPGYYAVCPEHDEDLYTFETENYKEEQCLTGAVIA